MSQQIFREILNNFCMQAVNGVCMASYRTKVITTCNHRMNSIINNSELTSKLLKFYINDCWENYHNKSDPYIVDIIDSLKKQNIINHTSCIFNLITQYCQHLFLYLRVLSAQIQYENLENDEMRNLLDEKIKLLLDNQTNYEQCDNRCIVYNYVKGENFCS